MVYNFYGADILCTACGVPLRASSTHGSHRGDRPPLTLRSPHAWAYRYRVLSVHRHKEPRQGEDYQLSGTAVYDDGLWDDYFEVPPNRYQASKVYRSGPPPFKPIKGAIRIPAGELTRGNYDDLPSYGFPLHDSCWTLIERVIGNDCAEGKKLHLLLRALLSRWKERPFPFYLGGILMDGLPCLFNGEWTDDKGAAVFCIRDPLHVPAINRLMRGRNRKTPHPVLNEVDRRKPARGKANNHNNNNHLHSSLHGTRLSLCSLPYDIRCLIADHLHYSHLETLLTATGWRINDQYWRSRFPWEILFEAEELDYEVGLDWQRLCLRGEELIENELGLLNRARILQILQETKRLFLSFLEEEQQVGDDPTQPGYDEATL